MGTLAQMGLAASRASGPVLLASCCKRHFQASILAAPAIDRAVGYAQGSAASRLFRSMFLFVRYKPFFSMDANNNFSIGMRARLSFRVEQRRFSKNPITNFFVDF